MTRWLTLLAVVLFARLTPAAPVPKALKAKVPVRAKIEPLPGEKLHTVNWNGLPAVRVFEKLEGMTGLMYLSKDVPDVKIILTAEKVCVAELFAQLDEILYPQGWVLTRKSQSFSLYEANTLRVDWKYAPTVKPSELDRRTAHEPLHVYLDVDKAGAKAGVALGGKNDSGVVVTEYDDRLHVRGTGEKLRAFVAEMGDHVKK
jgi:hypothetical protein